MSEIHFHSSPVLAVGAENKVCRHVPRLKEFLASVHGAPILPPIILRCGVPFAARSRRFAARSLPIFRLGGDHEHEQQEIQRAADCGTPPGLPHPRLHVSHPRKFGLSSMRRTLAFDKGPVQSSLESALRLHLELLANEWGIGGGIPFVSAATRGRVSA